VGLGASAWCAWDRGVLRPRRARCPGCLVTHVLLLPVTVLVRRGYAVEVIGAALLARAAGAGHRTIGGRLGFRLRRCGAGCG